MINAVITVDAHYGYNSAFRMGCRSNACSTRSFTSGLVQCIKSQNQYRFFFNLGRSDWIGIIDRVPSWIRSQHSQYHLTSFQWQRIVKWMIWFRFCVLRLSSQLWFVDATVQEHGKPMIQSLCEQRNKQFNRFSHSTNRSSGFRFRLSGLFALFALFAFGKICSL